MPNLRALVLCGFLAWATAGHAERTLAHYPVNASVRQTHGGGSFTGIFGHVTVVFRNLGPSPQHVRLALLDELVSPALLVPNPSGLAGWFGTGWIGRAISVTSRAAQNIVVSPNGTSETAFPMTCDIGNSGASCVGSTGVFPHSFGFQTSSPTGPNFIQQHSADYRAALDVTVQEDRGALSGMVRIWVGVADGTNLIQLPMITPLNGGRPL